MVKDGNRFCLPNLMKFCEFFLNVHAVPKFTFLKIGMLVSIAWTGGATGLVFWVLDQYNMLRVEMEHEFKVSLKCSSS